MDGRRAAKLYLVPGDAAFGCRACHGLANASQSEPPAYRAITRVQKLRMRLGGSANLLDPFQAAARDAPPDQRPPTSRSEGGGGSYDRPRS